MKRFLAFIIYLCPLMVLAQDDMRVYTVAGGGPGGGPIGDGGPATAAYIDNTEGIWLDGSCNLYISEVGNSRIRKVDGGTSIITTIAGTGVQGFSGDGGPATAAQVRGPYGLFSDIGGNVYIADEANHRIRRIDAISGVINTIAGGGTSLGDGGPATNAMIGPPRNVYGDSKGNIFIAGEGRIRRVDTNGIITTVAGTGVFGLSGDGGPATSAQISASVAGMVMDNDGNLFIADRANSRIRKISSTGIISTIAGTILGTDGDNGPATAAKLAAPISIFLDNAGNLIIGDNENDVFRKVNLASGIITYLAGKPGGSKTEGALATAAEIHPEFIYIDLDGNIYYSNYQDRIHKITHYLPGLIKEGSNCTRTNDVENQSLLNDEVIRVFPNPADDRIYVENVSGSKLKCTLWNVTGEKRLEFEIAHGITETELYDLPSGIYFLSVTGDCYNKVTCLKILKK